MSIIFVAALHDISEDTNGNLLASFMNHRAMWIAHRVVAVPVMPAVPLEAVYCNFSAWTIWVFQFMVIVTGIPYTKQSSPLLAHDNHRDRHHCEEQLGFACVIRMHTRADQRFWVIGPEDCMALGTSKAEFSCSDIRSPVAN